MIVNLGIWQALQLNEAAGEEVQPEAVAGRPSSSFGFEDQAKPTNSVSYSHTDRYRPNMQ